MQREYVIQADQQFSDLVINTSINNNGPIIYKITVAQKDISKETTQNF